jgi:hypothetical protein
LVKKSTIRFPNGTQTAGIREGTGEGAGGGVIQERSRYLKKAAQKLLFI